MKKILIRKNDYSIAKIAEEARTRQPWTRPSWKAPKTSGWPRFVFFILKKILWGSFCAKNIQGGGRGSFFVFVFTKKTLWGSFCAKNIQGGPRSVFVFYAKAPKMAPKDGNVLFFQVMPAVSTIIESISTNTILGISEKSACEITISIRTFFIVRRSTSTNCGRWSAIKRVKNTKVSPTKRPSSTWSER